ncbi:Hypothetical protein SMAX5B_002436 [Scophthalmus maximus]|uniref:Uncharacterized protein n=1 Tax=Scophthalmus maximus TaxID=52904 RepID=A0A2U9AVU5_SCOMX|nr:Hypothetical protein SMAX5B_002436 [Scophthalmus maximus]
MHEEIHAHVYIHVYIHVCMNFFMHVYIHRHMGLLKICGAPPFTPAVLHREPDPCAGTSSISAILFNRTKKLDLRAESSSQIVKTQVLS